MDLYSIKDPSFLKELNIEQLNILAKDIRRFIIQKISKTGGHLSSNLGVVELTLALHYVFHSPDDKIFFDVGHQAYTHKILTGRAKDFDTLRMYQGLSGFQKRCESPHDVWEAGHSSTALSAAVAMAVARDLDKQNYDIVPVIGDAAMVGGESLEALNHLGSIPNKVIVILNDNQMAIGKSVGGFHNFLSNVRLSDAYNHMKDDYKNALNRGKLGTGIYKITKSVKDFIKHGFIDDTIFEDFGIDYLGPVDGHDIKELIRVLKIAQNAKKSVVVHVRTKKGKGYPFAEKDTTGKWHGIEPFYIKDGTMKIKSEDGYLSWSQIVSQHILQWMEYDQNIVTITPAMIQGSSLSEIFEKYPERSFDVGIAEEHALTFTAGLSISKKKPFISVYSSFIQRAYDQINHDIARMKLPCLVSIDRAGIVGSDGPTHHGVFDISFLAAIPHVVLFAPKDGYEAKQFINTVFQNFDAPYFMRIPRGKIRDVKCDLDEKLDIGTWSVECHENDFDMTVITYGHNVNTLKKELEHLDIKIRIVNARFIKPLDYQMIQTIFMQDKPIIVYETDLRIGSLGDLILDYCNQENILRHFEHIAIDDHYSCQGTVNEIYKDEKIDIETVISRCREIYDEKGKN